MTTFDWNTASPEERLAEADRRARNRAEGRAPTDDGPRSAGVAGFDRSSIGGLHVDDDPVVARATRMELHLTLPWTMLVPDNQRWAPALRSVGGKPKAVLVMTPGYRTAKKRAATCLLEQNTIPPLNVPCRVTATLYEPNTHRRDLANYAKHAHDALTDGGVIVDDHLIVDLHWRRGGVDIDHPRLELTITPILRP